MAKSSITAPNLAVSAINIASIKEQTKANLLSILDASDTDQALIIDPSLLTPLSFIIPVAKIREHKVQEVLFISDDSEKRYASFHTVFLIRGTNIPLIHNVCDIITAHRRHINQQEEVLAKNDPHHVKRHATFAVYFVPRRSLISERILHQHFFTHTDNDNHTGNKLAMAGDPTAHMSPQERNVYDHDTIFFGEFHLDLIPIDENLLSLELPHSFHKIFVDGDTTMLYTVATSMVKLQIMFGVIPLVKGVGRASHRIAELMHRISCELIITSRFHSTDAGGVITAVGNTSPYGSFAPSQGQSQACIRSSAEQNSYHDLHVLVQGELTKLNSSVNGIVCLQEANRKDPVFGTGNNQEYNSFNPTAPTFTQSDQQLYTIQKKQTQQQQKSSLSQQLSSLTGFLSGVGTQQQQQQQPQQQQQQQQQKEKQQQTTSLAALNDLTDTQRPKVNINYNSISPVINSYTIPQIQQVVFIDRISDLISPMLLQRTYEGLLDEMLGINTQTIEFDNTKQPQSEQNPTGSGPSAATTTTTTTGAKKSKISVNNADIVYKEFRDINIKILGQCFSEKYSNIQRTYMETQEGFSGSNPSAAAAAAGMSVTEMEKIVKKFTQVNTQHKLLPTHWGLAKQIQAFFGTRIIQQYKQLEDEIFIKNNGQQALEQWVDLSLMKTTIPLDQIVRMIILYAALYGTVNRKKSITWRREILLTYGFEQMPLILNLQHMGVLFNTVAQSDDVSVQQQALHDAAMSLSGTKGGQLTQQSITQLQQLLGAPANQHRINNLLNLHITVPKTGFAPFSPLLRKPVWDKLFQRLKLCQSESTLVQAQQQLFNRENNDGSVQQDEVGAKRASLQTLLRDPFDIYFAYGNFYAPLSIRFVEMASKPAGLRRLDDVLGMQALMFTPQLLLQQSQGQTAATTQQFATALANTSGQQPPNNPNYAANVTSIVNVHAVPVYSNQTQQQQQQQQQQSLTSTLLSTFSSTNTQQHPQQHPSVAQIAAQPQIIPHAASTSTPLLVGDSKTNLSTMKVMNDGITNTSNLTMNVPTFFEYRQHIPTSLQQHMKIPDTHFFQYPLLSTTAIVMTPQQIAEQNRQDETGNMFMLETDATATVVPTANTTTTTTNPTTNNANSTTNANNQANQNAQQQQQQQQQKENIVDGENEAGSNKSKPVCLVYFIGGATHAEVAMLRFLSQKPTHKFSYVVATTKMTNSKHIIHDLQYTTTHMGRSLMTKEQK